MEKKKSGAKSTVKTVKKSGARKTTDNVKRLANVARAASAAKVSAQSQKQAGAKKIGAAAVVATNRNKPASRKKIWIMLGVVALVAIVAGAIVCAMLNSKKSGVEPEPEPEVPAPAVVDEPEIPDDEPTEEEPEEQPTTGNNGGGHTTVSSQPARAGDEPRWFSIPSLGLNGLSVVRIGARADGTLDDNYATNVVAWYTGSAKPGKAGVTLINGHGGDLGVGILKTLPRLSVGATINVTTVDGHTYTYVVRDIAFRKIGAEANDYMSTAMRTPEAGVPALTIITCTGNWIRAQQTYDTRMFVRATLRD